MKLVLLYLVIINAAGFLLMLADKRKAQKNLWRIPEKVLFGTAVAGGSLGVLAGIRCFRHKTRHPSFTVGIPLILVPQVMLLIFLLSKLRL